MSTIEKLRQDWATFREENPRSRIYDAARTLDVSEEQLLVIDENSEVIPLKNDYKSIFGEIKKLGRVMALTRNKNCVIETYGCYSEVRVHGRMGIALNDGIDLRMFLANWHNVYAVETSMKEKVRCSLQFFNRFGEAIHKIYLTCPEKKEIFYEIRQKLSAQRDLNDLLVFKEKDDRKFYNEVDLESLQEDWSNLRDTHEFHQMLTKHKVSRIDALQAMEGKFTKKIRNESVGELLHNLSNLDFPFMCFVGNSEMIQIFTGQAKNFRKIGRWLNFLDREFNLHLNRDGIDQCFVVRKPSGDGVVTSVEVYDDSGEIICQFFGARKPGEAELIPWRDLTQNLD